MLDLWRNLYHRLSFIYIKHQQLKYSDSILRVLLVILY